MGGSFGEAVGGLGFLGFPHIDVRKYISQGGVLRSISLRNCEQMLTILVLQRLHVLSEPSASTLSSQL